LNVITQIHKKNPLHLVYRANVLPWWKGPETALIKTVCKAKSVLFSKNFPGLEQNFRNAL
jgi:hypothetical protein